MTTPKETTPLLSISANGGNDDGSPRSVIQTTSQRFYMSQSFRSISNISSSMKKHMGRIGLLGSMSLACNSLTGPAMLSLPNIYQRAGLIPTTLTVIFVCILSAMCCLHMADTISKVPGNANFRKEVRETVTSL